MIPLSKEPRFHLQQVRALKLILPEKINFGLGFLMNLSETFFPLFVSYRALFAALQGFWCIQDEVSLAKSFRTPAAVLFEKGMTDSYTSRRARSKGCKHKSISFVILAQRQQTTRHYMLCLPYLMYGKSTPPAKSKISRKLQSAS